MFTSPSVKSAIPTAKTVADAHSCHLNFELPHREPINMTGMTYSLKTLVSSVVFTSSPPVSSVFQPALCSRPILEAESLKLDFKLNWRDMLWTTLETSGEDVKLHSKRVEKM